MTVEVSGTRDRTLLRRLKDGLLESMGRARKPAVENHAIEAQQVLSSPHEGGLLLLHLPSGRVFVCNEVGAQIWKAATTGLSLNAIAEEISREHGIQTDVVYRDAVSFVTDLETNGLATRGLGCLA
jgi:hypothetical protein